MRKVPSSIYLRLSVKTEMSGRPTLKTLRNALSQIAKKADADGEVTLTEKVIVNEKGGHYIESATAEVTWSEYS